MAPKWHLSCKRHPPLNSSHRPCGQQPTSGAHAKFAKHERRFTRWVANFPVQVGSFMHYLKVIMVIRYSVYILRSGDLVTVDIVSVNPSISRHISPQLNVSGLQRCGQFW
jgi:hypothetical protein